MGNISTSTLCRLALAMEIEIIALLTGVEELVATHRKSRRRIR